MLRIIIPLSEGFNEKTDEFVTTEGITIDLEHSLFSMSKWESKWEIPFLKKGKKTEEQSLDYIRMMILGELPSDEDLSHLSEKNINDITTYIDAKMTATWFTERRPSKPSRETITAELIYYWMISLGIPFECQHWHLNRLITLIRVCSLKNATKKKMTPSEAARQQRDLNAMRRAQTGSNG